MNWSIAEWSKGRWKLILHFKWKSRSKSLEEEWGGTEIEIQWEVFMVCNDMGSPICCSWSTVFNEVQSQYSHVPGNVWALHAFSCCKAFWLPLYHNSCKRRPNQVLCAYTWTCFPKGWHSARKYLVLCNIQIFWATKFGGFISCMPLSLQLKQIKTWNVSFHVKLMNFSTLF